LMCDDLRRCTPRPALSAAVERLIMGYVTSKRARPRSRAHGREALGCPAERRNRTPAEPSVATVVPMNPLETLNEFLGNAEGWLWPWAGMPVVVVLGLYFTIRSGAVQFRMIPAMLGALTQRAQREEVRGGGDAGERTKSLSAFQAFSISAAA